MAARRKGGQGVAVLLALSLAAPLLVLVAALLTRAGGLSFETGYDLLTMKVGWWLSIAGVAAALGAVVLALRDVRRLGLMALAAVVAAGGTLGGFVWHNGRQASAPPEDISTDLAEIPGFGDLGDERGNRGPRATAGVEACPGALPVMKQIAPESAIWALEKAGFTLRGAGVARADGTREGFWFGFDHDAVIRIRPGRTDIRVAARDARSHGGDACELVSDISASLQPAG
ncbi:DUF1499 domain-containing protein [Brevundimonas sp. Root1423]|uniref:DUF1499 domain-containing protein n=1 Tax=Brevundimonas sp. Root1423 TaxID=1736462 RepID=UPI000A5D3C91|nr:DUF1499 domain-containing protein [Brevundimonas sp. Root1423]